jgi:hypothetical protein
MLAAQEAKISEEPTETWVLQHPFICLNPFPEDLLKFAQGLGRFVPGCHKKILTHVSYQILADLTM